MTTTSRFVALAIGIAAVTGAAIPAASATDARPSPELTPQQAMLRRYVARCALAEGQVLGAFPGAMGLAPEWKQGKCDGACQEKVSSCLAALTNQTGLHVNVSMMSAAPDLAANMAPNDNDLAFPFQEGAFFGNVFAGEAFVCRGRDADKAAQLKRYCALAPASCSGIAAFEDAGRCEGACEMSCTTLSDGSTRCAAVRCRDPRGRTWNHPITTYLRNRIEAGNADAIQGAVAVDSGLEQLEDFARASYRAVDFGRTPGRARALIANVKAPAAGGRIEVWLQGGRRLGVVSVPSTHGALRDVVAPILTAGLAGPHDVELRFVGLRAGTRVDNIGLR
jgi:hypothetical protein